MMGATYVKAFANRAPSDVGKQGAIAMQDTLNSCSAMKHSTTKLALYRKLRLWRNIRTIRILRWVSGIFISHTAASQVIFPLKEVNLNFQPAMRLLAWASNVKLCLKRRSQCASYMIRRFVSGCWIFSAQTDESNSEQHSRCLNFTRGFQWSKSNQRNLKRGCIDN